MTTSLRIYWQRVKALLREDRDRHRAARQRHRELDAQLNLEGLKRPIGPIS